MPFLSLVRPKFMPKTLKFPLLFVFHQKPFSSNAKPSVAVFWDLKNKPPNSISLYDAAVRLRLAASSFGPLRFIAAFGSSNASPGTPILPPKSYPCRVCGRNFFNRSKLLHHFDQIHRREQVNRLNRINSARGAQRRQLSAKLAMKIEKFNKVAREMLVPTEGLGLVDDLKRAGVLVREGDDFANNIGKQMMEQMERRRTGCVVLVSDNSGFVDAIREARMRHLMTVVIGDEGVGDLKRNADVGFSWRDVVSGKARCQAESAVGKWKDKGLLKRLEWRYDEVENGGESEWDGFEGDGEDGCLNLVAEKDNKPWWKLDTDCKS